MRTVHLSSEVESVFHRAFVSAKESGHRWVTAEHLGLALLEEEDVFRYLKQGNTDVAAVVAELRGEAATAGGTVDPDRLETQPSPQFQSVVTRAIRDAEKGRQDLVLLRDVLLAFWDEPECQVAKLLRRESPNIGIFEELRQFRNEENKRAT